MPKRKYYLYDTIKIEVGVPLIDLDDMDKMERYMILIEDFADKVKILAEGYEHLGLKMDVKE